MRAVLGSELSQEVQPLGNNTIGFSVSLIAKSGNGLPKTMFINYVPCSLVRSRLLFPFPSSLHFPRLKTMFTSSSTTCTAPWCAFPVSGHRSCNLAPTHCHASQGRAPRIC